MPSRSRPTWAIRCLSRTSGATAEVKPEASSRLRAGSPAYPRRCSARTTVALLVPLAVPNSWALANRSCSTGALARYWATARSDAERVSQ